MKLLSPSRCGRRTLFPPGTRKTGGNETVMEDMRGAVVLLSAARSGRILNIMSAEQAEAAGVEERRLHFPVDNGKANLAPPPTGRSTWFKMTIGPAHERRLPGSIQLDGDSVGVVTVWEWPDLLADVTISDLSAVQTEIQATGTWRENVQANDWATGARRRSVTAFQNPIRTLFI